MELHERLTTTRPSAAPGTREPFAELKNRVHLAVIGDLGPQLFNVDDGPAALRERVVVDIRRHLAGETTLSRDDRERLARRSPTTSSATGRSSASSPTTRSPRSWSTARTTSGSSARAGSTRRPCASTTTRTCGGSSTRSSAQVGRRIDESSPMVDARLPDGSRVNAIIPPLSLSGPLVTIRKFSKKRLTLDDMVNLGTISRRGGRVPARCVQAELNILISGGTGTGKTTLLNALSAAIPDARPDRHDRGRGRAPAAPAARAPARVAPQEHRGRGRDRRSASSCATRCACGPTGSSSARSAAPRRSTCSRR